MATTTETETRMEKTAIELISEPLTLQCGLTLPNRLVKCPMQETLAIGPYFDPPMEAFSNLYSKWARSSYGLITTGQVQVDRRFLSIAGDVCVHEKSLKPDVLAIWKQWAKTAQSEGTPCIVQIAHPGRMSPTGAGIRPADMPALCPSSVPVKLGDSWLDKMALEKVLGTPKAMVESEIDEVVAMFVHAAVVAREAGFAGCQLHGTHGFLLSQFLSPYTNRRTDSYGGSPENRMKLLRRLVTEIREVCPRPYCLSVKLNSADYMDAGTGLEQEEGLEQISGGNAENKTSGLHQSFGKKTIDKAPKMRESTRIREAFFTEFAEKVQSLNSSIPIQLSGGFRSRTGMADALDSGICQMIGLGRAAVLEPELPRKVLLNPEYDDELALGMSHIVRGQWLSNLVPIKVIGSGLPIQFFYYNMKRLGNGLSSDPDASIPYVIAMSIWETVSSGWSKSIQQVIASISGGGRVKVE
nr:hypothetical protein B0A51_08367 [Rachicladosporium sp. CCFEE 5018]